MTGWHAADSEADLVHSQDAPAEISVTNAQNVVILKVLVLRLCYQTAPGFFLYVGCIAGG